LQGRTKSEQSQFLVILHICLFFPSSVASSCSSSPSSSSSSFAQNKVRVKDHTCSYGSSLGCLEKGEDLFREEGIPSAVRKNQLDLQPEKINVAQNMKMN
jgi:hypothetical protein